MKEIDFDRALLLMNIMEKQANVSPMLTSVSGEAAEELKGIAEDCRQNAFERADKIRSEEQVAAQKRLEAVKAEEATNTEGNTKQPIDGELDIVPNVPNIERRI